MSRKMSDYERVEIKSANDLRAWLRDHYTQTESIWVVSFKKHTGANYVSYDAIVDKAIAYGWIDSLPRKLDDDRTMLMLSRRKPNSAWSRVNKERVKRLTLENRMEEPGLAAVQTAKENGSWSFLDDVEQLIKPSDLLEALNEHNGAKKNFDAFSPSSQRGILEWIKQAKQPATRAKRIAETARLAAQNIKANHPK